MNFVSKFEGVLPFTGAHPKALTHVDTVQTKAPADAIIVKDADLLFNGDFKRSGADLVISKDARELVLSDYFKGDKHAPLASSDGAYLTGKIVDALTGHVQMAQADGSAITAKIIGHVTKLSGNATVIRNGVSVILNNGDNVYQGDVVQSGANSTLGITFIDGSVFGLGSNAKMVLNEMVYDPNGSSNSSFLSLVQGTISFVAGATAKHGDMKVDTPVATMGIRGTACLVEIDFEVTVPGSAPPARFQVLVEPDGTTGSYVLLDRVTLAPIANVNQAGTVTTVSGQGTVSFLASAQLSPETMKLINEVFSQKFTDNSNPKSNTHFTDALVPDNTFPVKFADALTGTATVKVIPAGDGPNGTNLPPPKGLDHIPGPPEVSTQDAALSERTLLTGSSLIDKVSAVISYSDVNIGDSPTVKATFDHFSYTDSAGHVVTSTLTAAQLSAIAAVSVPLVVVQDSAKNIGSATWTYSVADKALDFLADGETLTLTYMARVDNNFALNNEYTIVPFKITITGTNDVPTIVADHTTSAGGVVEDANVNPANDITAGGVISFDDADLTDTHTATFAKLSSTSTVHLPGFIDNSTYIGTFKLTPVSEDNSGPESGGTVGWTFTLDDDDPILQSLADGQTITQVYRITVDDGHGGTVTQDVTITITGSNDSPNNAPVIVGELTTAIGSVTEDTDVNDSNNIAADGTIVFRDIDLIDSHTATFEKTSSTSNVHLPGFTDNATYIGTFDLAPVNEDVTDTNNIGSVDWTFTLDDDNPILQSLAVGQTITQVYTVRIADNHGGFVTQDVTVTITGTNDTPVITSSAQSGAIDERADEHDSATLDTASGAVTFTDVDLIDTHAMTLTGVKATGTTSGLADENTLLSWLSLGTFTDSTDGVTGSRSWSFSAQDHYFDYLADDEQLTLTYTVQVDDHHGGVVTQDVVITVTGSNDTPVITSDDQKGAIDERTGERDSATPDTASGTVTFTDVDLSDTHSVTVTGVSATGTTSGLADEDTQLSWLSLGALTDSTNGATGSRNWSFSAQDRNFDYLAVGEQLVLTYTVQVDDHHGGVVTQDVVITVTGTNDTPVITSGAQTGSIEERVDEHDSATPDTASGTVTFTDVDLSDTHSVTIASVTAGGTTSGLPDNDTLLSWLSLGTLTDSTNGATGSRSWLFSAQDRNFDYLADGEQLVLTYTIQVDDHHGGVVTQDVVITIVGTNDTPVITSGAQTGTIDERAGERDSATPDTASGAVSFTDLDLTDIHATITGVSVTGTTSGLADHATQLSWLSLGDFTDSTDGVTGSQAWSFSAADRNFDYLAVGEQLVLTYTVQVDDHHGGVVTQDVVITVTGTNDAPVITSAAQAGTIDERAGERDSATPDTASGTVTFTDVDLSDTHAVTIAGVKTDGATSGLPDNDTLLSWLSLGTLTDSTNGATGSRSWSFSAQDHYFDYLADGEQLVLTYAIQVDDHHGGVVTQDVVITVTGTNDAPTVAAALTDTADEGSASFTQDLLAGASDVDDGETATLAVTDVTYSVNGGPPSTTAPAGVSLAGDTLTVNPANPAFDYLAVGRHATIVVSYDVTDVHGATVHQTETVTINGTNDAPSIVGETNPPNHAVMVVNPVSPSIEPAGQNTNTLGLVTETFDSKTAGSVSNNGTGAGNFTSAALGATFTASGHAGIVVGSSSVSAAPFMGPLPGSADASNYLSIGGGATETITFTTEKNAFGLYWGSVDSYNTITFYDGTTLVASYSGADISPLLATGNQGSFAANGYVDFVGLPFFDKVVLSSSSNAFEIDNISAGVVPAIHSKLVGTVSGTMSVHDPDIGDTLSGLVTANATVLFNNSSTLPNGVNVADLIKAGNITFDSVQSDGGTDVLHWNYDPHGANLDFLHAGDVLKLTYTAQVTDGHGSAGSQQLVITLVGTDNNTDLSSFKFVDGTSGNDTFSNLGGGATVLGNGGNDTFVFKPASGSATIADFDPATDTISFASSMFNHNPTNVLAATHDDGHGNTVITVNATDTITLQHVMKAQLSASDFHFV